MPPSITLRHGRIDESAVILVRSGNVITDGDPPQSRQEFPRQILAQLQENEVFCLGWPIDRPLAHHGCGDAKTAVKR